MKENNGSEKKNKGVRTAHESFWLALTRDHIRISDHSIFVELSLAFVSILLLVGLISTALTEGYQALTIVGFIDQKRANYENQQTTHNLEAQVIASNLGKGGPEEFQYDIGYWEPVTDDYVITGNNTIRLEEQAASVRFKYSEPVLLSKLPLPLTLAPGTATSVNTTFIRNELYEVTIGDNDLETVSLQASSELDGKLNPVAEKYSGSMRPRMEFPLQKGINTTFIIKEELVSTHLFRVTITPEHMSGTGKPLVFEFTPPPNWQELQTISVGLIDGGLKTKTEVYFSKPKIHNKLKTM